MADDEKETLRRYLTNARADLRWKLDGLGERDLRWPRTATGTNLLGILKHVSSVELEYLGDCFGRPSGISLPWLDADAEPNADMWATADESVASIRELSGAAEECSNATIDALDLDAVGHVPWWGDRGEVTLHRILVHVIAEVNRHAGHADILRESIDGAAGLRATAPNLPGQGGAEWWSAYVNRLRAAADGAGDGEGSGYSTP